MCVSGEGIRLLSCRSQQSLTQARPSACVCLASEVTLSLVSVSWVKSEVHSRCHVYGVHQDVLTQRPSLCVLCPGTPPARSASPRKPIGPHRRARRLHQEARVPPRGCPLPSLVQGLPAQPPQQTWGGGVAHFHGNRILGRRSGPSGATCPSGRPGARLVAGTCGMDAMSCCPPNTGSHP